jgi:hypothetical protein
MIYALLPYLTTSRPLQIRGVTFRATNDVEGQPADVLAHLSTITRLFFFREELRLKEMSYAVVSDVNDDEQRVFFQKLWEASISLKYICTCANPPTFPSPVLAGLRNDIATELAEMFLLYPCNLTTSHFLGHGNNENIEYSGKEPKSAFHRILTGYHVRMIGRGNSFNVGDQGKIYSPHFALDNDRAFIAPIDVAGIIDGLTHESKWAIKSFIVSHDDELTESEKRVFKALDWFNQSCERGLNPYKSLVFLAIAFEALINLTWDQKNTPRFKDVVTTLLGPIDRLEHWLTRFFEARGDIVHTGEAKDIVYYPPLSEKNPAPNREIPISYLTDQGRQIFHLCVDAILTSSMTARQANLRSAFKHDEERIIEIFAILEKAKPDPEERILNARRTVQELCGNIYQTASRVKAESLLNLCNKMVEVFVATGLDSELGISRNVVAAMTGFVGKQAAFTKSKDIEARIKELKELNVNVSRWYSDAFGIGGTRREEAFQTLMTLMTLLHYATIYLFGLDS